MLTLLEFQPSGNFRIFADELGIDPKELVSAADKFAKHYAAIQNKEFEVERYDTLLQAIRIRLLLGSLLIENVSSIILFLDGLGGKHPKIDVRIAITIKNSTYDILIGMIPCSKE